MDKHLLIAGNKRSTTCATAMIAPYLIPDEPVDLTPQDVGIALHRIILMADEHVDVLIKVIADLTETTLGIHPICVVSTIGPAVSEDAVLRLATITGATLWIAWERFLTSVMRDAFDVVNANVWALKTEQRQGK